MDTRSLRVSPNPKLINQSYRPFVGRVDGHRTGSRDLLSSPMTEGRVTHRGLGVTRGDLRGHRGRGPTVSERVRLVKVPLSPTFPMYHSGGDNGVHRTPSGKGWKRGPWKFQGSGSSRGVLRHTHTQSYIGSHRHTEITYTQIQKHIETYTDTPHTHVDTDLHLSLGRSREDSRLSRPLSEGTPQDRRQWQVLDHYRYLVVFTPRVLKSVSESQNPDPSRVPMSRGGEELRFYTPCLISNSV